MATTPENLHFSSHVSNLRKKVNLRRLRFPLLVLISIATIVLGSGYLVFDRLKRIEKQQFHQNLAAVANLKVDQITSWARYSRNTAIAVSKDSGMAILAAKWFSHARRDDALKQKLIRRLDFLRKHHAYAELALVDVTGKPLLTADGNLSEITTEADLIQQAIEQKQPVVGKLHWDMRHDGKSYANLPIAAPLISSDDDEVVSGVLWIELDAHQFLFPLIQAWPTPSETAETTLFRQDGDEIVFLNELRHAKDTALRLRFPVDHPTLLASQAARGATGFISGIDYRGKSTIGFAAAIPDTNWFMIAKIDEQEAFAPVRQLALNISLISLLGLAAASAALFFWWRQRIAHYKSEYLEAELQQQLLSQQYASLSRYANDAILLMNEAGNILEANERATVLYGYPADTLLGMNIRQLRLPDELSTLEGQFSTVTGREATLFEAMHVRSDGQPFPVEISSRSIETDNGLYIQSIIRDITERRTSQERERRLTNIYRALSATNEAIIHARSETELFNKVCEIAVEYGGMLLAWVGIPDANHRFTPVASFGNAVSYLNEVNISSSDNDPSGHGPSGIAYREGKSVVANNYIKDEVVSNWAGKAQQHGIRAASAYGVKRAGKPYAMIAVYSADAYAFDDQIVQLLEEMTTNIGFALDTFDKENNRKQAEDALQRSERQYRELFDTLQECLFVAEIVTNEKGQPIDWRYLETNPPVERYMGMTHDQLVGHTYREIVPQPDEEWIALVGKVALTGEAVSKDQYAPTHDRWLQVHAYCPRPGLAAVLFIDITEQRNAEEALQRSEANLKTYYDAGLVGVINWNLDGRITGANDKFLEIIGYSREDLDLGRIDWIGMTPPEYKDSDAKVVAELIETGRHGILEKEYVRKDGSRIAVAITSSMVDANTLDGIGFVLDISERMRMTRELERTTKLLADAQAIAGVGGWEVDLRQQRLFWTEETFRIHDLSPDEYQPTVETAIQFFAPDSVPVITQAIQDAIEKKTPFNLELKLITAKGRHIWVHTTCSITEEDGKVTRITGAFQDITGRKKTEEHLKLAAMVYKDSSEAMMITDGDSNIIAVNPAFEQMTGFMLHEVIGKNPRMLQSGIHEPSFYQNIWNELISFGRWKGELWNKRKNGELLAVQLTINSIRDDRGRPSRYVGLLSDITEKKQSEELIWSQANFDALTGLPNRRLFRDRLQHEIHNAQRSNLPLALMFLDLDGFKDVNDSLGHDMGDVLLKTAAERLDRCVRKTDTVARLGGDEFTVILTELHDPDNVDRVARHILRSLSEPIQLGGEVAYVSASVGITLYPNDGKDIETLIRNADQAMYSAKQAGKNRYSYFTPSMQDAVLTRVRLINDLRSALERHQFEIVYQPIVELATGDILKAEALIRWQHPVKGLINPIDFISTAEDAGMISSFGNWIFHEAAKQAAIWRERYHPGFQISVNISPMQFRNEGIDPSVWFKHLKELGLPGQGIVIEITEGLLLEASSKVTDQLLMLRDVGIEVALDDFGTGYSSLSYLKKFDIDYIKIDRSFVQNLASDSSDMTLCEAMIVMAHRLGIKVIAEGVETKRQHELLANGACDFAQGYLFSRPMTGEEFEKLLVDNPFSLQDSFDI